MLRFLCSFTDLLTLSHHGSVNHGKHAHCARMWPEMLIV